MDALVIFGATYLICAVVVGAAVVLAWSKKTYLLWVLGVSLPLVYVLARVAGMFYSHAQPFVAGGFEPLVPHEVDNSFPSDHTAIGAVFATVALYANRYAGLALWVLTLGVGLARMAAGLHYGVDIVAAILLGGGITWLVHFSFSALRNT